ncbi:MAG: aldehyde dehydrogenase family protein, partial [Pseudomonadota bacterium]|nr:aldehyde dehydrogenase family protein [Pseudomonadota bacterium]
MDRMTQFYIDGAWVAPVSGETMPVMNPANGDRLGTVALGNAEDVDRAVAAAAAAFETFSQTSKADRLALLRRIRDVSERRLEELAQAMRMEMGAPITFSREMQADAAIGHLDGFIDALEALEEREALKNGDIIVREPIGVCGLITPWNWPVNQVVLKVLPAIATGCSCILKPSEYTPLSAVIYAEILDEAGVPAGVFNMVHGEGPVVGAALSRHPDIQMMSFTGSTRAGKAVTQDSAETIKRVTLELGGKSPNLVFADCDLEERVTVSVAECMANTGQSCDAPTRLLVERSCYDEVLEIARRAAENTSVGDPEQEGEHLGPLFDQIQYDRVQTMIDVGIDEGARLL